MKHSILLLFCTTLILFSCGPSREKRVTEIAGMEERLFGTDAMAFDGARADTLIGLYTGFVEKYPDDTLSPGYLFKAANLAMTAGDGPRSLALFEKMVAGYPSHPRTSMAMFFCAYVNENLLHDLDKAKETYLLFIEKYPESDFADDAQYALENLGKTPEQMVKEFEMKQKEDSALRSR